MPKAPRHCSLDTKLKTRPTKPTNGQNQPKLDNMTSRVDEQEIRWAEKGGGEKKKGHDHFFQGSLLWSHPAVKKGRYIWPLAEHTTQLQRHKVQELLFVLLYSSRKTQKNKAHKSCSQGTDERITTMAALEFVTKTYIFERTPTPPVSAVFFTWDHYYYSCCKPDFNLEAHTRGKPVTTLM